LDHVVDDLLNLRRDLGDGGGWAVQDVGAVAQDRAEHHRFEPVKTAGAHIAREANRPCTRRMVVAWCASISSIESPPNFARKASASTNATIAAPTTPAAGTAQTSLRSIAAGASASVSRSTERSGDISVAIGF